MTSQLVTTKINSDANSKKSFVNELNEIYKEAKNSLSIKDYEHLRKIIWTNRIFLIVGYATSLIMINPISMILISLSLTGMWLIIAHHIIHKGYDHVPGASSRYHSKNFAVGLRKFLDWLDWIDPKAWNYEHNILHHYSTNEALDPDQMYYSEYSKHSFINKRTLLILAPLTWKFSYYAINTQKVLIEGKSHIISSGYRADVWVKTILKCYLPYILVNFAIIPSLFLLISNEAAIFVLINRLGAELLVNLHQFIIIAVNHIGADIPIQTTHPKSKKEFYLAQIISSCNCKTGGFWNDYFHGYLNYQIEHHIYPDLPPSKYAEIQPKVKEVCEKYNIPYLQESVFIRIKKVFSVFLGREKPQEVDIAKLADKY